MKVCLISPPTVTEFNERQVAESKAIRLIAEHAPMGILSLAAVLEMQGCVPHIVDLNKLYYDYVKVDAHCRTGSSFFSCVVEHLAALSFDVFGFSTICSSYPLTLRLAKEVKLAHPGSKIVLGGPQASVVDVLTLRAFPFVDFVVRGEAEMILPPLLDAISGGGAGVAHISGVTHRQGGNVTRNPGAQVISDLDALPLPAYHLFPRIEHCSYISLEAGRGCPFACSFCSTNDFFRRHFRMKSPQILVEQMRYLREHYGISSFDLVHDMFTVDRKKVISFCEAVEESGEQFNWSCSARTDCIDDDLISRMAQAGCSGVFFGIDTGSERMQGVIRKGLSISVAAARVRSTASHGMKTTVSLITGFPDETKEDLQATAAFFGESLHYNQTETQLHLLAPLAETPITTQFHEQLVYDEIFSDISFQGWEQDVEDRAMITAHRDIFPNFFAVPTRWLDRHYLKEFREFLLWGALRHRMLMQLLHADSGDLLRVFDEWLSWSVTSRGGVAPGGCIRSYYTEGAFSADLLRFVGTHYAKVIARYPHLVMTMITLENALSSLTKGRADAPSKSGRKPTRGSPTFRVDDVPVVTGLAMMVDVEADYQRLVRCLRRKGRFDRIPAEQVTLVLLQAGNDIKVLQLNQTTYQLLRLCDGSRSIRQVADEFSPTEQIDGVSVTKAALYGLVSLAHQGLIELKPIA